MHYTMLYYIHTYIYYAIHSCYTSLKLHCMEFYPLECLSRSISDSASLNEKGVVNLSPKNLENRYLVQQMCKPFGPFYRRIQNNQIRTSIQLFTLYIKHGQSRQIVMGRVPSTIEAHYLGQSLFQRNLLHLAQIQLLISFKNPGLYGPSAIEENNVHSVTTAHTTTVVSGYKPWVRSA